MLFHEIYSTYFQTVAKILAEAVEHPLETGEINSIIQDSAFEESTLRIPESLGMEHWQLLKKMERVFSKRSQRCRLQFYRNAGLTRLH